MLLVLTLHFEYLSVQLHRQNWINQKKANPKQVANSERNESNESSKFLITEHSILPINNSEHTFATIPATAKQYQKRHKLGQVASQTEAKSTQKLFFKNTCYTEIIPQDVNQQLFLSLCSFLFYSFFQPVFQCCLGTNGGPC